MRAALVVMLLALLLAPADVAGQEQPCDGDFHVVHDLGDGELSDIDFAAPGDGWAVGYDYPDPEASRERPMVTRFDEEGFEEMHPPVEPGHRAELTGLDAVSPTDVWAVGHIYPNRGETVSGLVYHWDGNEWVSMDVPNPGKRSWLRGISAVAPDDVWAVGNFERKDRYAFDSLVLHYDGVEWKKIPAPSPGEKYGALNDVDFVSATRGYAVGYQGDQRPLALRWNGSEWKRVWMPGVRLVDNETFDSVDAESTDNVWIVGDGFRRALAVHGTSAGWERTRFPDVRGSVWFFDVAATPTDAWAVGYRFVPETAYAVAGRWNGGWERSAVEGQGSYSSLEAVALDDEGAAWAVGDISSPDDPSRWTEVIERGCNP